MENARADLHNSTGLPMPSEVTMYVSLFALAGALLMLLLGGAHLSTWLCAAVFLLASVWVSQLANEAINCEMHSVLERERQRLEEGRQTQVQPASVEMQTQPGQVVGGEALLHELRALAQCSAPLVEVAESVGRIAGHANLLALNAAIVAARDDGGESGISLVAADLSRHCTLSAASAAKVAETIHATNRAIIASLRTCEGYPRHQSPDKQPGDSARQAGNELGERRLHQRGMPAEYPQNAGLHG